ncbi:Psy2 protein [Pichia kluyveri]|uniref:Psy2 protein n=1 Tax=Pichia kluyveri TaxID=36015 RepID=A0AAV5QXU2_PICKL|nr:Psy2 protein [Pichia kluyveri]
MSEPTVQRRVKLYQLSDDKWVDCGTGYCSGHFVPNPHFKVVDESEPDKVLLNSPIIGNTQYQRQQDTLIVWTNNDGVDYALSFQEPEGCLEICAFLINIQENCEISSKISLIAIIQTSNGETTELIAGPMPELALPCDDINVMNGILDLLSIKEFRGRIIVKILENNAVWLDEICKLFGLFESSKSFNMLYILNDIIKSLIYFNEIDLWNLFVKNNEIFVKILGILEFDPELQGYKLSWRSNWEKSYEESIEIMKTTDLFEIDKENNEFKTDVFKYLSFSFLKNTVLVKVLDETNINCINTLINISELKIINYLEDHPESLDPIFQIKPITVNEKNHKNIETKLETKSDKDAEDAETDIDIDTENDSNLKIFQHIKLLHRIITISKFVQNFQRTSFYTLLISKGLIELIEYSIKNATDSTKIKIRLLITELIIIIVEHDILLFKNFNQNLLNILINIFLKDDNIILKSQSFEAIKILIDPMNMRESAIETDEIDDIFLVKFYEDPAKKLFSPLININNETEAEKIDWNQSFILENIISLLDFISKTHDPIYSRSFILENHLLKSVNRIILNLDRKFKRKLQLNSIKCLKSVVLSNDDFYTHYIIENDIFNGFFKLLQSLKDIDNLISSQCEGLLQNIVEKINDEVDEKNMKLIAEYFIENFKDTLADTEVGMSLIDVIQNRDSYDIDDDTVVISHNTGNGNGNESEESKIQKRPIEDVLDDTDTPPLISEPKKRAT